MGGNGGKQREDWKNVVCQEQNGGKWRENTLNFPIITVFMVPIFPIFSEASRQKDKEQRTPSIQQVDPACRPVAN